MDWLTTGEKVVMLWREERFRDAIEELDRFLSVTPAAEEISLWDERDLAVRLFRRFVQARRNYNPAILVFRGLKHPLVYRFYYAFQEAKHGNELYVRVLEKECFAALELGAA